MYRLGDVKTVAQGLLIVRLADAVPEIGIAVVDEQLTAVGKVVDVFGPVSDPYAAITPSDDTNPATFLGETLYANPGT